MSMVAKTASKLTPSGPLVKVWHKALVWFAYFVIGSRILWGKNVAFEDALILGWHGVESAVRYGYQLVRSTGVTQ